MKNKIEFEKIIDFGFRLAEIRRDFPEFAQEIDRLHYDIGQKTIAPCEHEKCDCKMSFEDFHAGRNRLFGTTNGARSYEFN